MKKILILILILIMLITVGCINPLKEAKNLKEMGKAMEEGMGLIDKEKTKDFYEKSCSYIKENGLSDKFSMYYFEDNNKAVTVEYNSVCKSVLVEYLQESKSDIGAILYEEGGTTLVYSEKTNEVSEKETSWDDYSEYFEKFNSTKLAFLEIMENIEPNCCDGYESNDGLPYNVQISYNGKDVKKLKVFDFDIESLEFYFSCDEKGEIYDEFCVEATIDNSEMWRIWFGDSPSEAMNYEEMKEQFNLKL